MKTAILILCITMAACVASQPDQPMATATTDQASTFEYCRDGLGPIECWPDSPAQGDSWCMSNCSWFNDQPGYCPEYTQIERNYCVSHCRTDTVNCDASCQPQSAHRCIVGWPP